ncbi:MAG TPA: prepilin-type N-terminal cleavage/methylation domain-containing protein [Gemmatimonadales bacterium]|jgi:prepilin-type N-terminal cleavage/methylation domain-containing protein
MKHPRLGFTLVEVLVAILVLGVGVLALVGSSAGVSRMIGRGKVETRAAQAASSRMETLRLAADATSPRCSDPGFASGGPVLSGGMTESWLVPQSGRVRQVRVTVTYLTVRGAREAVLETALTC